MRFFPRRKQVFTPAFRGLGATATFVFLYALFLPEARLFAQEYKRFNESAEKLEAYTDRATRLENEESWTNYMELGVGTERAQWEQDAFDQLQQRLEQIESSDLSEAEKESEIERARAELKAASDAWNQEAEEFTQGKRGEFRAEQTEIEINPIDENLYMDLIAGAEAAVAAQSALDLDGWEAAIQTDHAAIVAAFETELADELNRARGENAGIDGAELVAFENELADIEAGIRREFEVRDRFYVTRARNRYIALKRGDDLNARLASEESSATSVTDGIIESTLSTLEQETSDMLDAALDETRNLVESPDTPDFEAAGVNWEARMEAMISSGLRAWEQAEEDLYARRLAWQQEQKRSREEARKIWEQSHEEIKNAREEWIGEIQVQIKEGREQWQSKIAEFRENRAAAEQEMADYIAAERERWEASSNELGNIVNGGGGALLETKDAYRYYDDLIKAMGNPAGGSERDRTIYAFYEQQRGYMQGAVQRFQGILASAEGVLNANLHSSADHSGLLNDVRIFAGDLPQRLGAIPVVDGGGVGFEENLRATMNATGEDFVLYRRDMEDLIDRNAVFSERATNLDGSSEFDYQSSADLNALVELIGKLERKYDEHKGELRTILNEPRAGLDDAQRLAAIKSDIQNWLALSTDKDRRLKKETTAYFNASLGGYYLTGQEGDPYLMTRAEYEWELLRRERNYLTKKLRRAEAVKDYADRAFQHDAGLEMAAVTAERSRIARTHRDLREIAYQLIRGEIELDPAVKVAAPGRATVVTSELDRILAERGIDRSELDRRESTLSTESGILDDLLAIGTAADADQVNGLIARIDAYLEAEIPAVEERPDHQLGIVREKLLTYRDRVTAGAGGEERTNSWTALLGGAGVLREEIQNLANDYDFAGLRTQVDAVRAYIERPNLSMIRGDLDNIKEQITANEELLADARERLELAKDAYRQARIDYDIMRANNSEDLVRIDLTNTTGSLGRVIHRMRELEDVGGFDGVYDPLTAGRINYLNEISLRETAQNDLAGSQEALLLVNNLESAKKRLASLESLLGANSDLGTRTAEEQIDLFLDKRDDLVTEGNIDPALNSGPQAVQALKALEQLKAALASARQKLSDANTEGDAAKIELARVALARTEAASRRNVELLVGAIRGEERSRRDAFFYYIDSRDASGDPTVDPETISARVSADDRALSERVFDIAESSAAAIADFLRNNARRADGSYRSFAELLKLANDAAAGTNDSVRLSNGYGYDDASAGTRTAAIEADLLRNWLVENRAAIETAGKDPDENDTRPVADKWDLLIKGAEALSDESLIYDQFQAAVPADSSDAWVTNYRSEREGLLADLDAVLSSGDAGLAAAYNALPADRREVLAVYGGINGAYLRKSIEAQAAALSRDLADLDTNFAAIYRREARGASMKRIASIEEELAPLQEGYNSSLIEKALHEKERARLADLRAAETDPAEQTRLDGDIADLDARIGELTTTIDTLRPDVERLSDEYRLEAARAREASQPGSSSKLAQAVMGSLALEGQNLALLEQTARAMQPVTQGREAQENTLSAQDQVKVALGFYQTDAAGGVLRDGSGKPLLSQEFIDLGVTDSAADLATVLAGDQSGANLMRWAERLSAHSRDETKRAALPAEVIGAMDLLEDAIREVLSARAFVDNRYETRGGLQTSAAERRRQAQEGLKKLGLVLDLQSKLEEAIQIAAQEKKDPAEAALALLEVPENAKLLRAYAGYDQNGDPDGVVDPIAQARQDELIKLAERLRATRLNNHLGALRASYAEFMGQYVAFARGEPLALAPDRQEFLDSHAELKHEPVKTALDAINGDESFRAGLWDWTAGAGTEARFYRGRVIEILTASAAEGQALKDEVLAAMDTMAAEIDAALENSFGDIERRAHRDANLAVETSVANLIDAYSRRATTTTDLMSPAIEAIDDLEDFETAKTTVRLKLQELAEAEAGEAGAATHELRRAMRAIISEAGDTVQLKSNLRVYLNGLADPPAAELARLDEELQVRSLLESFTLMNAAGTWNAESFPEEMRELLLVRSYQNAARKYDDYAAARQSTIESERENARLDLSGMNGDMANYFLVKDFAEYRAANDPAAFPAANAKTGGVSIGEYLSAYLKERNSAPELLPAGGQALIEELAETDYIRLQNDIAANGIAAVDAENYFSELHEYIRVRKARDYMDRNGVVLGGATAGDRAAELRAHFETMLDDPAYTARGKTLGQSILLRADRDAYFGDVFSMLEYAVGMEAYLPSVLDAAGDDGLPGSAPRDADDFLPADLTAIADYATRDFRAYADAIGPHAAAALARNEAMIEARGDLDFAARRLSDAELAAIADRAGYAGAGAALRGELVDYLRLQNEAALTGGAASAAQAVNNLRSRKILEQMLPDRSDREALTVFLSGEGNRLQRIEAKFFNALGQRHADLVQATKEERGNILRAVIERAGGGTTPFYNGLSAELKAEVDALQTELYGAGDQALTDDERAALATQADDYRIVFDLRGAQTFVNAGLFEALEAQTLAVLDRAASDSLRENLRDRRPALLRALIDAHYVHTGNRAALSAESRALFDANTGLEALLTREAGELPANLVDLLKTESVLVERFLGAYQETESERAELDAFYDNPALLNPIATLSLSYEVDRDRMLLAAESRELTGSLAATIENHREYFDGLSLTYEREIDVATELQKFASTLRDGGEFVKSRYSSFRTYVGTERKYQDADLSEEEKYGGVLEARSLASVTGDGIYNDPEALLNRADREDLLRSDAAAAYKQLTDDQGEPVHLRQVYSISDPGARNFGGDYEREMRHTYFANIANNYLDKISKLNGALSAVFHAGGFADRRTGQAADDIKQSLRDNYDPAAAANDVSFLESKKVDAQSRLAIHSTDEVRKKQGAITSLSGSYDSAADEFAQAARRDQISTMPLEKFLREVFQGPDGNSGIAGELRDAEAAHTSLSNEAERLRGILDLKNRDLARTLSSMAENWRQYERANDEYEERAQVQEYAETPYLFASQADAQGDEKSTLIEEYRGDAKEEYELARRAVDYIEAQLKEAAYAVYTQDDLDMFGSIVAGLENGQTYAALTSDETERLLELRDRKHRDYETLSTAEEQELTSLDAREMYSRYKDVIETRAEHIKHAMRMVRVHKANELIRDEVMRRRAVADEKEKQFNQALATEFGSFEGDAEVEARNGVYARLAGQVEGGATNLLNEFRSWYWGGNQWANDAFNSYVGASQAALKLVEAPKFWPTQIMEGAIGLAGAAMTNARDRNAIGLWIGAGGSMAEWGMFQGVYYAAIQAMGVRDQMKLKKEITYAIYMPIYQQAMATSLYSWGSIATARMAKIKMEVSKLEANAAQQNMWLLYGLAASTATTGSIRRVMGAQREYEDAQAALYYFTRIPDQQTLKDRMIGYGAAQSDDPNDNSGASLYKLTEEDLVYLFDQNQNGDPQYLDRNGNAHNPSQEVRNEALDITDVRDRVEYRDSFGRRYDPRTVQDGQPGALEGGYYWNGNERWTRLRFFSHDGGTRYRYAKIIDEDAELHTVYNMEDVLKAAVPHGQSIRDDRFKKYMAAGDAVAGQLQDQTFILNERDATFENLFNQSAGHVEGGREFTGYKHTYADYRRNTNAVYANEITQREKVQLKEWELREKELLERYQDWEERVATILDRGTKSWAGSEDRFLQKWRQWERDFENQTKAGQEKWDEEIAAHFKKKKDWEDETRAQASEATIEKVLGDQIDALNRQLRATSGRVGSELETVNRTAMIQDAIQEMRRELPSGGAKLKAINKNIKDFSAKLSTSELIKGNFQNEANTLASGFRKEMNEHQHRMKVLANVKVFEQYRKMIAEFKKKIQVQNRQIANQTAGAALAQGYVKVGDTFIKKGNTSKAYGVVNAYKWFDVERAMDDNLKAFGFTPMTGNELVGFLDSKSNVEVESYFYTQKLAVQASIEAIQGRGSEQERKGSRDAKVIGQFSAWVGSAKAEDPFHGHAETLAGNSFGGANLEARGWAIDMFQAGFGELGAMGTRPGGAPAGFYVQLKHMGKWVAEQDAAGVAAANEADPITNTINAFNPVAALATSYENVEVGEKVYGRSRGKLIGAQVLNVGKQALVAGGQVMMTLGNAVLPGIAVGIGAAMIAVGNAIQVNPTTGESAFKMTDQAAVSTVTSIAGALIPGLGPVASAALQAGIGVVNAGMEYDSEGRSQGWKMNSQKLREKGTGIAVSAIGAGLGAELGDGSMLGDAIGSAVGNTFANNLYQHSQGNRQLQADAATVVSSWGSVANSYASSVAAKAKWEKKNPGKTYEYSSVSSQFGAGERFLAGAIGSVAGTFAPVAKLGFAAYESWTGEKITPQEAEKEKKEAEGANKTNKDKRLKDIQDAFALRQKNRGLWSRLVVHGAGAIGLDSDKVGNWMDGSGFESTQNLISYAYKDKIIQDSVDHFNASEARGDLKGVSKEHLKLLGIAGDPMRSQKEREEALQKFTQNAAMFEAQDSATRILSELQARGSRYNNWGAILKSLGNGKHKVSQAAIDKLKKELGMEHGADMDSELNMDKFKERYRAHKKAGAIYDAKWRYLKNKKYSPAQIRRLIAGADPKKVGRPEHAPPPPKKPGPKYTPVTKTNVSNPDRKIIADDLIGKDGAAGWVDKKLGSNLSGWLTGLYKSDNVISNSVRDRDVTRGQAAAAYDEVRQDISDGYEWTRHRLENMDWKDAGWNALRMVGGGLQAFAGVAAIKAGAALSATGIGAIIGVPMIAAGGFMVANGAGDIALGAGNIYKNFMGEKDRFRGNIAELYKASTGKEAPGWVDYVDMGAGMVGSLSGIGRGIMNGLRGAGAFAKGLYNVGMKGSKAIFNGAKSVVNGAVNLGSKVWNGAVNLGNRMRQGMSNIANRIKNSFSATPQPNYALKAIEGEDFAMGVKYLKDKAHTLSELENSMTGRMTLQQLQQSYVGQQLSKLLGNTLEVRFSNQTKQVMVDGKRMLEQGRHMPGTNLAVVYPNAIDKTVKGLQKARELSGNVAHELLHAFGVEGSRMAEIWARKIEYMHKFDVRTVPKAIEKQIRSTVDQLYPKDVLLKEEQLGKTLYLGDIKIDF